jgi:hypothetical protein
MENDTTQQPRRNRRKRGTANTGTPANRRNASSRTLPLYRSLQTTGQSILPQRKTVIVSTQWTGYLAPGTQSTSANFASILPNSLVQPFLPASGNNFAATVSAFAFKGTSSGGSATASNPVGYTYLSSYWQTYKVVDYEVILTVNPQLSGDAVAFAMAPLGDQEQPASGANWTYFTFCAQRYCQSGRATNGANTRLNSLRYSGPFHRDLGLTKQQWLDFPKTAVTAQPSGNNTVAYFGIFLCSIDGSTNVSPIVVDVLLRQRVIMSDPVQGFT